MTKIIAMLRSLKKRVDTTDAEQTKSEFSDPQEFMKHFSYRKGGKRFSLKDVGHIARLYRKLKGYPRFWDFEEEVEEETLINELEV
jgi:hypothetical protein